MELVDSFREGDFERVAGMCVRVCVCPTTHRGFISLSLSVPHRGRPHAGPGTEAPDAEP